MLRSDALGTSIVPGDGTSGVWSPSWSPDSRTVYFVSNLTGAGDLWQQPLTEQGTPKGPPLAVTAGLSIRRSAAFSPAHDKLAYSQGRSSANLWRAPILEARVATWADAEQLTFETANIEAIDLSADEETILLSFYSSRSGNRDIWVLPVNGGRMRQLTRHEDRDSSRRGCR